MYFPSFRQQETQRVLLWGSGHVCTAAQYPGSGAYVRKESLSSLAKPQTHIHILTVEKEESERRGGQTSHSAD